MATNSLITMKELAERIGVSYSTISVYIARPELYKFVVRETVEDVRYGSRTRRKSLRKAGIYEKDFNLFSKMFKHAFDPHGTKVFGKQKRMYY